MEVGDRAQLEQMEEALIAAGHDLEDMDEEEYEQLQMALVESMNGGAGDAPQAIVIDDEEG